MPKTTDSFLLERTELAGRVAGVGYSDDGMPMTEAQDFAAREFWKIALAKAHHVVSPAQLM